MSASVASPTVLLNRIFSLRESCPFILVSDTFIQSATFLTNELVNKAKSTNPELTIIHLSFETPLPPSYLNLSKDRFINLLDKDFEKLINQNLSNLPDDRKKLIIIDSFNYIPNDRIVLLLKLLMKPSNIIYGIYHQDIPSLIDTNNKNKPSSYSYLHYLSSCVFDIKPINFNDADSDYYLLLQNGPHFPLNIRDIHQTKFYTELTYRRKSGRSLDYKFLIDSINHQYEYIISANPASTGDDESLLENLTTFNLGTTKKQKEQRDKVDLPFLEAQQSMGSVGGSIVYEFEKDDDYDEEDAFEDPF